MEANKNYKLIGKAENFNRGANFCNVNVLLDDGTHINIKLEDSYTGIVVGGIYQFVVLAVAKEEEIIVKLVECKPISECFTGEELERIANKFLKYAPVSLSEMKKRIEKYISLIDNKILHDITKHIYTQNEGAFFLHPAATKFHHAYVGGLSYHTLTMLDLASAVLSVYSYLDKDLLYAGIILHDMAKIKELSGADGEYTTEGMLLGHLVMETIEIDKVANELGLENNEMVLLLKHLIISHHGQYNFGSPKKPQTAEALMLWTLDAMDSKFRVLEEELAVTKPGNWTNAISVLDKMRFFKLKK